MFDWILNTVLLATIITSFTLPFNSSQANLMINYPVSLLSVVFPVKMWSEQAINVTEISPYAFVFVLFPETIFIKISSSIPVFITPATSLILSLFWFHYLLPLLSEFHPFLFCIYFAVCYHCYYCYHNSEKTLQRCS